MKQIEQLSCDNDYNLFIKFSDGITRKVNFKDIINKEVFQPLIDLTVFKSVKNKGYFIEWDGLEIDMSADTLWHEGNVVL